MTRPERQAAFPLGCRVQLSAHGRAWLSRTVQRCPIGTVVGHGRRMNTIIVLRDGLSTENAYSVKLWERVPTGTGERAAESATAP